MTGPREVGTRARPRPRAGGRDRSDQGVRDRVRAGAASGRTPANGHVLGRVAAIDVTGASGIVRVPHGRARQTALHGVGGARYESTTACPPRPCAAGSWSPGF